MSGKSICGWELGPDSGAKICSFESSFEYFSNSFVKEVFKGVFKGAFKGAKFLHQNRDPGAHIFMNLTMTGTHVTHVRQEYLCRLSHMSGKSICGWEQVPTFS